MSTPVPAHRARSSQDAKRRKRKDRKPKNRAPEPKEIVSGAGQPLDRSTRRELEERLGHDFSRVRLHTDRDAGELADMLGADAVAIGQDILFSPGKFRPGTADGEQLLAHELLHTVQNPDGLGALRAGRDLGAVSLPQQAIEREAESGARERNPEVRAGRSTPGWLRYAKVDADRTRMEVVDPATFVDRLANGLLRSLRGDPEDRSKRTRKQLARMSPELRESVLDRLESRLLSSEQERVLDFVEEIEADDNVERSALSAPEIEPDAEADLRLERETRQQESAEQQEREDEPAQAAGPDKEHSGPSGADGSTPENAGPSEPGAGETDAAGQNPDAPEPEESEQSGESASEDKSDERSGPEEKGTAKGEAEGGPGEKKDESGEKKKSDGKEGEAGGEGSAEQEQEQEQAEEKAEPVPAEPLPDDKKEKPRDDGSPKVAGKAEPQPGAVSELEGTRNQDAEGPQEKPVSPPAGGDSEVEVGGGEESAWDVKLRPEDFLPAEDLDVSGVPTADKAEPGSSTSGMMPSFPAPSLTRADQVQAERDAEDAEDEAAEAESEEATAPPLESDPSVETEGGPGATGLADLATEAGPAKGHRPADPKAAEDQQKGPVEAQRTAQETAGRTEGDKDAAGGAVKEFAAEQEKEKPGEGGSEREKKESGEAGKQERGKGAETGQQDKSGEQGQDESGGESGGQDKPGSGAPTDSKEPGGQGEQPGGESSKPTEDSGKSEAESPKPQAEAPPKPTEEPARTETPSPKAPAPKSKSPKAEEPKKAAEPSKPEAAEKQEAAAESAPSKSGPAPAAPRGGGRGSTGGSGAKPAAKGKKSQAVPNLAQASPEAGLRTASGLKPHQAMKAMNGVSSAADRSVGDEHKKLSSAPPSMQRPSGAPQTLDGEPKADAPAEYSTSPADKADAPEKKDAEVKDQKKPEGKIPAEEVEEPDGWDTFLMSLGYVVGTVASWFDSDVKPEDLAAKFAGMPTQDEALKEAQAGTAPGVEMKGDAGEKSREQDESVDAKGEETAETGRDDTERRMGEDQVYPKVPKEELRGKVPERERGKGGGPDGGANTGAVPEEAASEVAEHERGKEFKSSFSKGEQSLAEAKRKKEADSQKSKEKHRQSVDREVQKNTEEQAGQRQTTLDDVTGERQRWRDEQDAELQKLGTKKSEKREQAEKDVDKHEKDTDKKAEERKEEDNGKIRQKGRDAESEAKTKRTETENQAGNWVEKAFEYIKQKFIELRDKIIEILRNAREKIIEFVENFKFDIEALINEIRETIIGLIKKLVEELVELAKALVQAVIDLANKIREFIADLIERAIALVNKLAEALKQLINDLLEAIAKLLNDILSVLKKALEAMVQAVKDAIKAVLDFASKLLSGLGQFMMIAADFLSDPGGWLSGAKGSAEDGAKNHFFREVKNAVKTWFQQKIEEIIGLPKEIINKLIKGGLTLEWIVKQVWDAVVPQLPFIIGEIVITKVIAKLIPGAGWVMAVIDAIKTAIGALGEILRAFGAVLTWLRSVRKGGAGVLFAKAVAAGVVALLELAYEFLLSGIGKYVGKVGSRLKDIAKRMATKGRKKNPGQGADDEDPGRRPGRKDAPGPRKDAPGPRNTRPGEGSRGPDRPNARPGTNRRNERPGRR
ncbi:eCIS core domain-containing protein, partial [Saccharopolyspora kobensis]